MALGQVILRFLNRYKGAMPALFRFLTLLFLGDNLPQSVMNVNSHVAHVLQRQLEHQCGWSLALIFLISHNIGTVTVPCAISPRLAMRKDDPIQGSYKGGPLPLQGSSGGSHLGFNDLDGQSLHSG